MENKLGKDGENFSIKLSESWNNVANYLDNAYIIDADPAYKDSEDFSPISITILNGEYQGYRVQSSPNGSFEDKINEIILKLEKDNIPIKITIPNRK